MNSLSWSTIRLVPPNSFHHSRALRAAIRKTKAAKARDHGVEAPDRGLAKETHSNSPAKPIELWTAMGHFTRAFATRMLKAFEFLPERCEQAARPDLQCRIQRRQNHTPSDSTRESGMNSASWRTMGFVPRNNFHHSQALAAAIRNTNATEAE